MVLSRAGPSSLSKASTFSLRRLGLGGSPARLSVPPAATSRDWSLQRHYATSSNVDPIRPQARVKAELPNVPNRKPVFLLAALIAIGSWSAFASFATNKERLSSSVFKSALVQLKDSAEVQKALGGEPIMLVPSTFGDPWVSGSVNMMQGRVDMSFRLQGPKDAGTAYFTSIRRDQTKTFEVLRFLVVTDSGETVSLLSSSGTIHDSDGEIESNVGST